MKMPVAEGLDVAAAVRQTEHFEVLHGRRAHVLVVEDNAVNQQVAEAMLKQMGCSVTLAANGLCGLQALRRERFDMVLMDCQMPEIDGFEALRRFRTGSSEHYPCITPRATAVVALTANEFDGVREQCLSAGFHDSLSKPFRRDDLVVLLNKYVPHAERSVEARKTFRETREEGAVDQAVIDEILAMEKVGSPGLLERLITIFIASGNKLIADLRAAVGQRDVKAFKLAVHTLKSSSGNLGGKVFSRLCAELEARAAEGEVPKTTRELDIFEAEFRRLAQAFQSIRQPSYEDF